MTIPSLRALAQAWRRPGEWVPVAVLLVVLAGWSVCVAKIARGHMGNKMDDGLYFVSAQALRAGEGYTLPSQPGPAARPRYPIGLPALLALALWLAPGSPSLARDVAVSRAVVLATSWVFFLAAYLWLRRLRVSPCSAVLIVLATAFHVTTVGLTAAVMSDVPFAAVACVMLARWAAHKPRRRLDGPRRSFWNGAIAGAGTLVRGNGVTLVLGSLCAIRARSRRRAAALLACLFGTALVVLPLHMYSRLHSGSHMSSSYSHEFAAGWESLGMGLSAVARNVRATAVAVPYVVISALGTRIVAARPLLTGTVQVGVWLVLLAGLVELVRVSRRRDLPAWTHVAGTFFIFWVWPWHFSERCVLSLFPAILLASYRGVSALARILGSSPRAGRRLGALALGLTLASSASLSGRVFWNSLVKHETWTDLRNEQELDAVLDVIRTHLEPDAVIVSLMPEMVYLYAGRQGTMTIDDGDRLMGRLGRRAGIESAIIQNPGRPFYFLSAPAGSDGFEARHTALLARDPALAFREIYRTRDNRYWLAQISLRQPASPP